MNRELIYFFEQERKTMMELLKREKRWCQQSFSTPVGVYLTQEQLEQEYITQLVGLSMKQLHKVLEKNAKALEKKPQQKVERDNLIIYRLYILHVYYDKIIQKLDRILKYLHSREIIDHYLVSMATKRMESPHEDITSILVSHNHTPIPALDYITRLICSEQQCPREGSSESVGSDENRRKRRR